MNAKEVIKHTLNSTNNMLSMYLSDLSDADLLVRPVPAANHTAWQLGHLIVAEAGLLGEQLPGTPYPEFPAGFKQQHDRATSATEPPKGFATKAEYLKLAGQVRTVSLAALDKLSDADLGKPTTGSTAKFAPTLAALFLLLAEHTLMHAGQFTVVRRKLGKPVLF